MRAGGGHKEDYQEGELKEGAERTGREKERKNWIMKKNANLTRIRKKKREKPKRQIYESGSQKS